jgi:hypothetical protein
MARFFVGKPIETSESSITVDGGLDVGRHHFQLEVVTADGRRSLPMVLTIPVLNSRQPDENPLKVGGSTTDSSPREPQPVDPRPAPIRPSPVDRSPTPIDTRPSPVRPGRILPDAVVRPPTDIPPVTPVKPAPARPLTPHRPLRPPRRPGRDDDNPTE